jgi:hypothetical protein
MGGAMGAFSKLRTPARASRVLIAASFEESRCLCVANWIAFRPAASGVSDSVVGDRGGDDDEEEDDIGLTRNAYCAPIATFLECCPDRAICGSVILLWWKRS